MRTEAAGEWEERRWAALSVGCKAEVLVGGQGAAKHSLPTCKHSTACTAGASSKAAGEFALIVRGCAQLAHLVQLLQERRPPGPGAVVH